MTDGSISPRHSSYGSSFLGSTGSRSTTASSGNGIISSQASQDAPPHEVGVGDVESLSQHIQQWKRHAQASSETTGS